MTDTRGDYRVIELLDDPQKCNDELVFHGHIYYCEDYRGHEGRHTCQVGDVILTWTKGNGIEYIA